MFQEYDFGDVMPILCRFFVLATIFLFFSGCADSVVLNSETSSSSGQLPFSNSLSSEGLPGSSTQISSGTLLSSSSLSSTILSSGGFSSGVLSSTALSSGTLSSSIGSSSSVPLSSTQSGDCARFPDWDAVGWDQLDKNQDYHAAGDLYRCTGEPAFCAYPPNSPSGAQYWTWQRSCGSVPLSSSSAPGSSTGTSSTGLSSSVAQSSSSPAGSGLAGVISESVFNSIFPNRSNSSCHSQASSLYTYQNFLAAATTFPAFASSGSDQIRKREVAAFLANVSHETTGGWGTYDPAGTASRYQWGFCWVQEVGCESGCSQYGTASNGQTYHGRGPMQLSYSYNYQSAGDALGVNLVSNPNQLISNGQLAFETAIWFWMTAQSPKPSAHDVMVLGRNGGNGRPAGFGLTVNIINGGVECGKGANNSVKDRIGFYTRYTSLLGTTQGSNVDCYSQTPYGGG